MIRSSDFLLCEVADAQVIVPLGATVEAFSGMITLNETGVILWNCLEKECSVSQLAKVLTEQYDVSETQATADVELFLERLRGVGAVK